MEILVACLAGVIVNSVVFFVGIAEGIRQTTNKYKGSIVETNRLLVEYQDRYILAERALRKIEKLEASKGNNRLWLETGKENK